MSNGWPGWGQNQPIRRRVAEALTWHVQRHLLRLVRHLGRLEQRDRPALTFGRLRRSCTQPPDHATTSKVNLTTIFLKNCLPDRQLIIERILISFFFFLTPSVRVGRLHGTVHLYCHLKWRAFLVVKYCRTRFLFQRIIPILYHLFF